MIESNELFCGDILTLECVAVFFFKPPQKNFFFFLLHSIICNKLVTYLAKLESDGDNTYLSVINLQALLAVVQAIAHLPFWDGSLISVVALP